MLYFRIVPSAAGEKYSMASRSRPTNAICEHVASCADTARLIRALKGSVNSLVSFLVTHVSTGEMR